jgi:hypothetical protein
MKYIDDAVSAVSAFCKTLQSEFPLMSFTFNTVSHEEPFRMCFRKEIPALGAKRMSGIYFIAAADKSILYIGKATSRNLGAEIYAKFGSPVIASVEADEPRFEKSLLAKWAGDVSLAKKLISGDVMIFAIAIEPAELASLVEVFLHTWCVLGDGELPPLNKRIG